MDISNNQKFFIAIIVLLVIIFFKTCSINYNNEFRKVNNNQDSIINVLQNNNQLLLNKLQDIENTQLDIIQYSIFKDELKNKQEIIEGLKIKLKKTKKK